MKNSTHGFDLFTDTESFLSDLSMQEESLLSGGCGKSGKSKSGKSNKSRSQSKSKKTCVIIPVVVGTGY